MNQDKIKNVAELIRQADAVLVGAGSGLSSAAGYNHYHYNEIFKKYFKDFEQTYGIRNLFQEFIMFTQSQSSNGDFIPDILHSWKSHLPDSHIVISMNV